jgi:hypothetical protein
MKVQEANGRQREKISYNSTQTDLLKSNLKKNTRSLPTFSGICHYRPTKEEFSMLIGAELRMHVWQTKIQPLEFLVGTLFVNPRGEDYPLILWRSS